MQISIMLKGPRQTGPDSGEVISEAHEWLPGETVEQLVSRLLYATTCDVKYPKGYQNPQLRQERVWLTPRAYAAWEDVIEIRLIKELGE